MKSATLAVVLLAAGATADYPEKSMVFPAPRPDPTYQRCNFDFGTPYGLPCKDAEYPNCEGMKHGVSWGRCFQRPTPPEELAIDPRYQRCRMDFGNDGGSRYCQDPDYPDCIKEFCYARSSNPMPVVKGAPRPDPSGQNCARDYRVDQKYHSCKKEEYPVCEGMIHGKQWGRCMSASTEGFKKEGDPEVKEGVVYENELILSHNDTDPKLKVYEGAEIEGVKTWSDAFHFCWAKGRRLPWRYEWCNGKWSHYQGKDVWGGRVAGPEYKWTAVQDNYAPNTLLQLADTLDSNGDREVCKTYFGSPEAIPEKRHFDPFCKKPDDSKCKGSECEFTCPDGAKEGFYPDPNDCQAVCYCSENGEGSFWEKVTENVKEVWDPWCGESRPLDRQNVPLAGMTGGCMRKEYYVDDKSYCDGSDDRRRLGPVPDNMRIDPGYQPKIDAVMCVKTAKFHKSQKHATCGAVWGDPHVITYDGLRYSAQGIGDHILAMSSDPDSGFELQGKFTTPLDKTIKGATILTGFHLRTGNPNEPDVEFDFFKTWHRRWWIDGKSNNNIDRNYAQLGTQTTGTPYLQYFSARGTRMFYYPESQIQLKVTYNFQSRKRLGFYINIELCLPDDLKQTGIIGMLGTPDDDTENDWMTRTGDEIAITDTKWKGAYDYVKENWCIEDESNNHFTNKLACEGEYDSTIEDKIENMDRSSPLFKLCGGNPECILDGLAGGPEVAAHTKRQQGHLKVPELETEEYDEAQTEAEEQKMRREEEEEDAETPLPTPLPTQAPTPAPTPKAIVRQSSAVEGPVRRGSTGGDPHFKTWTGEKYDYHGECDLVLLDHPGFYDGLGLKIHIRTTRVKYFSFIEIVTVQIGEDVLEFDNDVENFLINGATVDENKKHHKTYLSDFVVNRSKKALSIRLVENESRKEKTHNPKIDLHMRKNGFPAVIVDAAHTDIFKGSLGLLGDWETGKRLARDGKTEMNDEDPTAFALEWQVRDTERVLFSEERFPQYPDRCIPPEKMPNRVGMDLARKEAEEACGHWKQDKDDCIFDVMATRDVLVAQEGHIVHIE